MHQFSPVRRTNIPRSMRPACWASFHVTFDLDSLQYQTHFPVAPASERLGSDLVRPRRAGRCSLQLTCAGFLRRSAGTEWGAPTQWLMAPRLASAPRLRRHPERGAIDFFSASTARHGYISRAAFIPTERRRRLKQRSCGRRGSASRRGRQIGPVLLSRLALVVK